MTPAVAAEKPDLFERIAQSLPAEQREDYWREIAYLKHLDSEDELLRLTRATGYLTQISQSVSLRITEEREQFEKLLSDMWLRSSGRTRQPRPTTASLRSA